MAKALHLIHMTSEGVEQMKRTEPMNVVISGMGRIAWPYHMPTIHGDPRFRLIAACDPLPERRAEAEAKYPGLRTYADYDEMLRKEPTAELAVITSPTTLHRPQSIAAMERGMDVFCEKPMTESLEAARAIEETVKRTGRKFMVYQPHRARPEADMMRELRASGLLGRIFLVRRICHLFNRRTDWQSQVAKGGGMIRNYGVHYIDQFLSAFGPGPLEIKGCSLQHAVGVGDADDVTQVLLRTPEKILCHIDINIGSAFNEAGWYAYGEFGAVKMSEGFKKIELRYLAEKDRKCALELETGFAAQDRKYGRETDLHWIEEKRTLPEYKPAKFYDHVWNYFAEGGAPVVPLADSMEVMRIIDLCRQCPIDDITA